MDDEKTYVNPEELAGAEAEAARLGTGKHTYTHAFKKPFAYMGQEYTEMHFDFDGLTGRDGLNIERELQALGAALVHPALSGDYLVRLAAKACAEKVGSDAFELMRLFDANKILGRARSFLLLSV